MTENKTQLIIAVVEGSKEEVEAAWYYLQGAERIWSKIRVYLWMPKLGVGERDERTAL